MSNAPECPNCHKELALPLNARLAMERYVKPVTARAECCGTLVRCYPFVDCRVASYIGHQTEDDWGG